MVSEPAALPPVRHRMWRRMLLAVLVVVGAGVLGLAGRSTLSQSVSALDHLRWRAVGLAVFFEGGSMVAVARVQRRLFKAAGGVHLQLGWVLALTYAGNAISVSLPLAGPEAGAMFSYRQLGRKGLDHALVAWALAVSGVLSSLAFALVLAVGSAVSRSATAAIVGFLGAVVFSLPTVAIIGSLRSSAVRRALNHVVAWLVRLSRRLIHKPGPEAEEAFERFLTSVAAIRLHKREYVRVFVLSVWNWVADALCLALSLRATGIKPHFPELLLVYCGAVTAGSIGLTPGGLGIVEAAMTAGLVAVGIPSHHALTGVLVYRLISFWLVIAVGWTIMAFLTRGTRKAPRVEETA